jgi:DNA-binding NarL/FixJ family response regulator
MVSTKHYAVIIIEDDLVMGNILKSRINETALFRCKHIFEEPISFLKENEKADIILLDVVMAKMNGLDAIEQILNKYPDVAIIMNTIKDDTDTIFGALQKGAVGYLDKQCININLEEVLQTVASGGAYMTPLIAKKVVDSYFHSGNRFGELTNRERDVTNLILDGYSYKMIATEYDLSIDTVRFYIKNIYRKLKINSKGELFNLNKK